VYRSGAYEGACLGSKSRGKLGPFAREVRKRYAGEAVHRFIAEVVAAMAVAVTVPDINMECVFSWFLAWSDAASGMKRSEGGGLKCHAATDRD